MADVFVNGERYVRDCEFPSNRIRVAYKVINQLHKWVGDRERIWAQTHEHSSGNPKVCFVYEANGVVEIRLGGFLLWSSIDHTLVDLTLEYCKTSFLEQLDFVRPFAADPPKESQA